jgi:hypothetical protein
MTPEEFVNAVRDQEIEVDSSLIIKDNYMTVRRKLTLQDDIQGLTAEAFQHGAFDPAKHSWEAAKRRLQELIKVLR